jgi:hypothetical protein
LISNNNNINVEGISHSMKSTLVNVRIPTDAYKETKKIAEKKGYKNVQEYIRHVLREATNKELLDQFAGSGKGKMKPLTRESKSAAQRAYFEERGWDYDKFIKDHAKAQQ